MTLRKQRASSPVCGTRSSEHRGSAACRECCCPGLGHAGLSLTLCSPAASSKQGSSRELCRLRGKSEREAILPVQFLEEKALLEFVIYLKTARNISL